MRLSGASPLVRPLLEFRDLGGVVVPCLLGRAFVPMVCDGSLLAGHLLRLSTLRLCNKRLLTSDWRG
jgi:hypothetical protein